MKPDYSTAGLKQSMPNLCEECGHSKYQHNSEGCLAIADQNKNICPCEKQIQEKNKEWKERKRKLSGIKYKLEELLTNA